MTLDVTAIDENAAGAVVGNLTVTDPDVGQTHTFTVSDSRFEVVEGALKLKSGLTVDFESDASVVLQITVNDSVFWAQLRIDSYDYGRERERPADVD